MALEAVAEGGAWASYKAALAALARASERLSHAQNQGSEAKLTAERDFQAALTAYHQAQARLRNTHAS